tara:strand:+ start:2552 stop:4051 length:1500 start_codon:yes stop_codon:yes gene_type:complete
MAVTISQKPLYRMLAANEEIIFGVKDTVIVATKFKVKYVAEVYVGTSGSNIFTQIKAATLKTTPNNTGIGVFDFSRILESYVSPEYLGGKTVFATGVQYYTKKNQINYSTVPHSIHEIDKHSTNKNACRRFAIRFYIEYADTIDGTITNTSGSPTTSDNYYIHNATRQEDDILGYESQRGFFGYSYDYHEFVLLDQYAKFLTNAPTTQYIGENDYCTIGYFAQSDDAVGQNSELGATIGGAGATRELVKNFKIRFFDASGSQLGAGYDYPNTVANGSFTWLSNSPIGRVQFTGVGTANIKGAGGSLPSTWDYYTIRAFDNAGLPAQISKEYRFYKQEVCKGFEKFRLTWLNRMGVWDYFNFTKRNVRKVTSKRQTYQQIKGNWNELIYSKNGYKGGTKTFSTSAKEVVTLQTDYITEEAAAWLEELFTSPDVFVLQERTTDDSASTASPSSSIYQVQNKYVQPCIITSKSYTRKTTANDKLKQYTVDIEMSHSKIIQRA